MKVTCIPLLGMLGAASAFSSLADCVDSPPSVVQPLAAAIGIEVSSCEDVVEKGLCTHSEAKTHCCTSCASAPFTVSAEFGGCTTKDQCCASADCQPGGRSFAGDRIAEATCYLNRYPELAFHWLAVVWHKWPEVEQHYQRIGILQGHTYGCAATVDAWGRPACFPYCCGTPNAPDTKDTRCGSCFHNSCQGGDQGARCNHDYECQWACVKSRCTFGLPDENCEKDSDCVGAVLYNGIRSYSSRGGQVGVASAPVGICHENICREGNIGDECGVDADCQGGICALGKCSDGIVGASCDGDFDCLSVIMRTDGTFSPPGICVNRNAHIDKIGTNTCQAGQQGSFCEHPWDCPFSNTRECKIESQGGFAATLAKNWGDYGGDLLGVGLDFSSVDFDASTGKGAGGLSYKSQASAVAQRAAAKALSATINWFNRIGHCV